jgi:hypothetical protein
VPRIFLRQPSARPAPSFAYSYSAEFPRLSRRTRHTPPLPAISHRSLAKPRGRCRTTDRPLGKVRLVAGPAGGASWRSGRGDKRTTVLRSC